MRKRDADVTIRARVMAHDVFIDDSSKDKVIADAVCGRLEAHGIRCWIAPRDVRPGASYGEEIIDGIHGSRAMVLVLSASANASPHIPKEVERAVSRGIPIIPLRVEDVLPAKSLDYFISSVHWLDAITPPLESHLESLATTIRTLLPQELRKEESPNIVSPVGTPAAPRAEVTAVAAGTAARANPKWLYPAIGLAVVALTGWYFLGRGDSSGSAVIPAAVVPTQPSPRPIAPDSPPPGSMSLKPPGADPIIGCWQWMNNASVVISANGTMTAGPFVASWRLANSSRHVYNFSRRRPWIRLRSRPTAAILAEAINTACPCQRREFPQGPESSARGDGTTG